MPLCCQENEYFGTQYIASTTLVGTHTHIHAVSVNTHMMSSAPQVSLNPPQPDRKLFSILSQLPLWLLKKHKQIKYKLCVNINAA